MFNPILNAQLARERYQELLDQAERRRLIARATQGRLTLARRVARPLGRILLRLGAGLLRYGLIEQPNATQAYRPSARSIKLN